MKIENNNGIEICPFETIESMSKTMIKIEK